jgi:hypothetical protein
MVSSRADDESRAVEHVHVAQLRPMCNPFDRVGAASACARCTASQTAVLLLAPVSTLHPLIPGTPTLLLLLAYTAASSADFICDAQERMAEN